MKHFDETEQPRKQHFQKLRMRKEQINRVWEEHPEAMIQFLGGALMFIGMTVSIVIKAAGGLTPTETLYVTDGKNELYSFQAKPEKSITM